MGERMDLASTIKGSMVESYYPAGWDLAAIERCIKDDPAKLEQRERWWHRKFELVACDSLEDFGVMKGHEIAMTIRRAREAKRPLAMILPVGPMGMYRWAVYFLTEWGVSASHVHAFTMDEWSDAKGNTVSSSAPGSFRGAMEDAFYGPLGKLTVPRKQRFFALKNVLPTYGQRMAALKKKGATSVVVFGIGRTCHIAFWEPHFAAEYKSETDWKKAEFRLAAKLHPMTIEQNAITSFKSRSTRVSCYANTIGPGLFLKTDTIIGGAEGVFGRGMQWQGMTLWMSLHIKPTPWIPGSYMTTRPGRLFYHKDLAGPLIAEAN